MTARAHLCPNCKAPVTEEQTTIHNRLTTWEVCDECGHTRMTKEEVKE